MLKNLKLKKEIKIAIWSKIEDLKILNFKLYESMMIDT